MCLERTLSKFHGDYIICSFLSKAMTSRHKLEQFPFSRYLETKMCNCHYACFDKYNILYITGKKKTKITVLNIYNLVLF